MTMTGVPAGKGASSVSDQSVSELQGAPPAPSHPRGTGPH
jgi:hypothetical protein